MRYLLRRSGFYLIALWAAITLNFLIPRLMPGDPVLLLVAKLQGRLDPRAIQALRLEFGLNTNESLFTQYLRYLGDLAHGNFGISINYYPTPVSEVVRTGLFWTLGLVGVATIISFVLGTALGAIAAWKRGSWFDTTFSPLLTFFQGIPYFWLALLLLFTLGFLLKWFPLFGGYSIDLQPALTPEFVLSVAYHAVLPALTIVISSVAGWMLGMRNPMIATLSEDYVLMAQAKGLSERRANYLCRTQCHLAQYYRLCYLAGLCHQRRAADRDYLLLSRCRLYTAQCCAGRGLPADAGHLPDHCCGCAGCQFLG
jgi:peptide/nickel transport system permease protein